MKKTKKMASIVLCIAMVLVMMPLNSALIYAEEASDQVEENTDQVEETTEPVTVNEEKSGYSKIDGKKYFDLYFNINQNADAENLDVVISKAIVDLIDKSLPYNMPGDKYNIRVYIENNSGHDYDYKSGSLVLSTNPDKSSEGSPQFLGYDGMPIPLNMVGAISFTHPAIMKLFKVSDSSEIEPEDVFNIYNTLKTEGTEGYTGPTALSDYMLDYYRGKDTTQYADWNELIEAQRLNLSMDFAADGDNGIMTMQKSELDELCAAHPEIDPYVVVYPSSDDMVNVQVKWPEEMLATMSYNLFYEDFFAAIFGDECAVANPYSGTDFTRTRGIGDYFNHDSALYNQTDEYLSAADFNDDNVMSFDMALTLDFWGIGNQYQLYDFSFLCNFQLERKDYTVIYNDGVDGEVVFPDQTFDFLPYGENTPGFEGTPTRDGYTFIGWTPVVEDIVTHDAYYEAQWKKNDPTPTPPYIPPTPDPTPTPTPDPVDPTPTPDPVDPQPLPPDDPLIEDPDDPTVDPQPLPSDDPLIEDEDPKQPLPEDDPLIEEPEDPDQPKTGDEAPLMALTGLFLASAGALGGIYIRRRNEK